MSFGELLVNYKQRLTEWRERVVGNTVAEIIKRPPAGTPQALAKGTRTRLTSLEGLYCNPGVEVQHGPRPTSC
jgi:hypothetical protein